MTPIIYVYHPFRGDWVNLAKAERWCADLSRALPALFVAPWIPLCRHWPNDGDTLRRGIELDVEAVHRCDGLVAVGGPMSANGRIEFEASHNAYDLSEFETFDEFTEDSGGHTLDVFAGWIREMALGMHRRPLDSALLALAERSRETIAAVDVYRDGTSDDFDAVDVAIEAERQALAEVDAAKGKDQ